MDGSNMPPEVAPVEAFGLPPWAQRTKATLSAINWRVVAVPFVLVTFLVLLCFTVLPLMGTPAGLWITTGAVGVVSALVMWPKTIWRSIVAVANVIWKAMRWVARAVTDAVTAIWKATKRILTATWAWFRRRSLMDLVFLALWLAVLVAALTLYILDASFYGSVAPPSVSVWIFRSFGVVFRTFVIFGGLAIVWLKQSRPPKIIFEWKRWREEGWRRWVPMPQFYAPDALWASGAAMRTIQMMGLAACIVSAMGFVAEGNDYHARRATASISAANVATESQADKIARLNRDKDAIRKDRDAAVQQAERSISRIENDGVPGISSSDNESIQKLQAEISKYNTDAAAQITAKDTEIGAAENASEGAKSDMVARSVETPELAAVWQLPARYLTWLQGIWLRDGFSVLWVLLLEIIGSFGAQALYTLHIFIAKRRGFQTAGAKGGNTTQRRRRQGNKLLQIEHYNQQKAATDEVPVEDDGADLDGDDDGDEGEPGSEEPDESGGRAPA